MIENMLGALGGLKGGIAYALFKKKMTRREQFGAAALGLFGGFSLGPILAPILAYWLNGFLEGLTEVEMELNADQVVIAAGFLVGAGNASVYLLITRVWSALSDPESIAAIRSALFRGKGGTG